MQRITDDSVSVLETPPPGTSTIYDLVANVVHESTAGTTRDKENTVWKVHVRAGKPEGSDEERWYVIQDLIIEEIAKEMLFLGETVLQVRLPISRLKPMAIANPCFLKRSGNDDLKNFGDL